MSENKKIDVCNFPLTINECDNKPHKPNVSLEKYVQSSCCIS